MSRTRRRTAALALVPVSSLALATLLTLEPRVAAPSRLGRQRSASAATTRRCRTWQLKPVDSTEQFRGLDAVSRDVAWVGGSNGSVFRTVDGGDTWDERLTAGRHRAAVPRRRGVRPQPRSRPRDRRGGRVARSTAPTTAARRGRRRSRTRTRRVLRLHGVLGRPPPRPGGQRPRRRQVPHHRDAATVVVRGRCARPPACPTHCPASSASRPAAPV